MWYDRGHENTSLHPTVDRTRTSPDPSRLTLQRRLCLTNSSGPARIRSRGTCSSDLPTIRVPQTNSTQYPPRLQCRWLSRLRGRLFASPSTTNDLPDEALEALRDLLHRSPHDFGLDTSVWTLSLAAQISFQQGLTSRRVSGESVRRALKRLGKNWKRAKHWITSPDPQYLVKKGTRPADLLV